jgi:pilus assembly protein CpaF
MNQRRTAHRPRGSAPSTPVSSSLGAFGFGPLDEWLDDDDVSEVLVNAGGEVWVERRTLGAASGPQFAKHLAPGVLEVVIERILTPIGRRLDRISPMVDARLPDGSRVCAVLPPIAVDGPCLAVRRFTPRALGLDAFASPEVAALLRHLVLRHCNIVVSGATSSGKTTLLGALTAEVGRHERVITLEDTAELQVGAPHVLRLETRTAGPDGLTEIDMAALVRTALRLRPDRLVVGEIRGAEAVDLLQALNTGHDGSLATLHANTPGDALARLESLVVRSAPSWPIDAVREQVHRSIDAVVHVARDTGGARHVDEVAEVLPIESLGQGDEGAARTTRSGTGAPVARTRLLADAARVLDDPRRGRR